MAAAFLYIALNMGPVAREDKTLVPKLLVGHDKDDKAPFVDSTGAQAGALLGDVRQTRSSRGDLKLQPILGWRLEIFTKRTRESFS